ncbi:MAG TPA: hypothetical protein DCP58_02705 [Verrucomicrobiales bacterium]|nr:hypothetical protein [Verrucomicrobiales bacterium]
MVLFLPLLAGAFFATFFTVFLAAFSTAFLAVFLVAFLAAFFAAGLAALLLPAGRPLRLAGAAFADPPSAASISARRFSALATVACAEERSFCREAFSSCNAATAC